MKRNEIYYVESTNQLYLIDYGCCFGRKSFIAKTDFDSFFIHSSIANFNNWIYVGVL